MLSESPGEQGNVWRNTCSLLHPRSAERCWPRWLVRGWTLKAKVCLSWQRLATNPRTWRPPVFHLALLDGCWEVFLGLGTVPYVPFTHTCWLSPLVQCTDSITVTSLRCDRVVVFVSWDTSSHARFSFSIQDLEVGELWWSLFLHSYFSADVRFSARLSLLEGPCCKTGVTFFAVHVQPWTSSFWAPQRIRSVRVRLMPVFYRLGHFQRSSVWNVRTVQGCHFSKELNHLWRPLSPSCIRSISSHIIIKVHFAKLIINAFVGNSGHVLFGCQFDFTLALPKTTHSTLTKQSDSEVLPLSISGCLFQKVSRRQSVGRLRHLHFVDHQLYLVCPSSHHASSFQTLSRLRSSPRQLSRLCSSRTIPYIFLSVFQDVRISVWSWATRLTFPDWADLFNRSSSTAVARFTLTHPMRVLIQATCASSFPIVLSVSTPPKGNWVWHPLHPDRRISRGWLYDEHCCGGLRNSRHPENGEIRVCIRRSMLDVFVFWFLHMEWHRQRNGGHLFDVQGLCYSIRHDLVTYLNVRMTRELKGAFWRHFRWSLLSLSKRTEQRVFRLIDVTGVDDILTGRRLRILDSTLWSDFPDCAEVLRHKNPRWELIKWLGNCGVPVSLRKNPSWALIKYLLAESSRSWAHGRRQPMSLVKDFSLLSSVSVIAIVYLFPLWLTFGGPAARPWHYWVRRLSQISLQPSACLLRLHLRSRCLVWETFNIGSRAPMYPGGVGSSWRSELRVKVFDAVAKVLRPLYPTTIVDAKSSSIFHLGNAYLFGQASTWSLRFVRICSWYAVEPSQRVLSLYEPGPWMGPPALRGMLFPCSLATDYLQCWSCCPREIGPWSGSYNTSLIILTNFDFHPCNSFCSGWKGRFRCSLDSLLSSSMGTELRMFRSSDESSWSPEVESDDFRGVRKFKNSPLIAAHPSCAHIKWLQAESSRAGGVVAHSSPWRSFYYVQRRARYTPLRDGDSDPRRPCWTFFRCASFALSHSSLVSLFSYLCRIPRGEPSMPVVRFLSMSP